MATAKCPKIEARIQKAILSCESTVHSFSGGYGLCCYVWVTARGRTPAGRLSKRLVNYCIPSNCLDSRKFDKLGKKLSSIYGYHSHKINID